ncbi:ubiquinone biosynthesis regulatory protein kinase UbiB [Candidatus Venteria ishoeyi]|uniref:ubiquinone biosynthesis regulatory protein kinase UbiB n=1 Tax=Candidatus Venteria ishoeyi TaxID=1899563 RepID=UPI0025A51FEF|nr:ubiquinone biosynthesis regulatory protein kinase UbiB [Candidatus Venteria ishoeyi]MDM8546280.1 ubiquinone biosynthesis regulatory protein kinase UbiB [Candidatus Venteria ishoeyi]
MASLLPFRQVLRLFNIYHTLVRNGLDEMLEETQVSWVFRLPLYLTPSYWLSDKTRPRGERIRHTLEELGPIFIKFGQILSTRRDLLPDDIAEELAKLQDRVRPLPPGQAEEIITQAYRKPLDVLFREFDPEPLAAASIAQVHKATLNDGEDVVVKVVRPGIRPKIRQDVEVMYLLAHLAQRYSADGRRLRPVEVVQEFEHTLYNELDLFQEAANCTLLRRNFENSELLYIPEVEWDYTHKNVMVMERMHGVPVSDMQTLRDAGVNFRYLAEAGVEVFFTQVFRDNFFHADMHPGNIFIDITNPEYPAYIAVDFGIVGTLNPSDQHYLAENFLAFFNRDYRKVAQLHVDSEWVPLGTRVEEFESAIRSVCEPIFNRPLKEISFGLLLLRLFQTARRFNMEIQPQLVLLQKTLLNIEGLGRQLYPDLDLWQTAQPFLERWVRERIGVRAVFHNFKEHMPELLEALPELPGLIHDNLAEIRHVRKHRTETITELRALRSEVEQLGQKNRFSIGGGALLISGALILALESLYVLNMPLLGVVLASLGMVLFLLSWL